MKIAFASTNMNFCGSILEELQAHHTVRVWKWTKNNDVDIPNLLGLIDWADLVYVDFIQHPLPWITSQQWIDKPIITRMDGLDILEHVNVNWNRVAALVLMPVQEKRLTRLREMWHKANPGKRLSRLPKKILRRNVGIDLELFKPDYNREPGHNIVFHSSVVRATKRVYSTLQLFYDLIKREWNTPWHLTIIGQWEGGWNWRNRKEYVMATSELLDQLNFPEDRLTLVTKNFPRPKWAEFAKSQDVVWCNSYREGFPNSVGECCASGVFPIMNWFFAAETIYPEKYLCRIQSEMIEKTIGWRKLPDNAKRSERTKIRKHIEQFSRQQTSIDIRKLCEELIAN